MDRVGTVEEVGVRELRAHLSRWLKRVERGDEIVVTDRGAPIARIVAPSGERIIDRLAARGLVIHPPTRPKRRTLPPPIKASGSVSDLVIEGRR